MPPAAPCQWTAVRQVNTVDLAFSSLNMQSRRDLVLAISRIVTRHESKRNGLTLDLRVRYGDISYLGSIKYLIVSGLVQVFAHGATKITHLQSNIMVDGTPADLFSEDIFRLQLLSPNLQRHDILSKRHHPSPTIVRAAVRPPMHSPAHHNRISRLQSSRLTSI